MTDPTPQCTGPFSDAHDCPVHKPTPALAPLITMTDARLSAAFQNMYMGEAGIDRMGAALELRKGNARDIYAELKAQRAQNATLSASLASEREARETAERERDEAQEELKRQLANLMLSRMHKDESDAKAARTETAACAAPTASDGICCAGGTGRPRP